MGEKGQSTSANSADGVEHAVTGQSTPATPSNQNQSIQGSKNEVQKK